MKIKTYKAQWPMTSTEAVPKILIYDVPERRQEFYLPATEEYRDALFAGKYLRVYFRGWVKHDECHVEEFVRYGQWI